MRGLICPRATRSITQDAYVLADEGAKFLLFIFVVGVALGHGAQQVGKVGLTGLDAETAAIIVWKPHGVEPGWGNAFGF